MSGTLEQLADLVGVAAGYTDAFGARVETALERGAGLLAALGFAVGNEAEIAGSLRAVEALRRGLIPPLAARRGAARPPGARAGRAGTRSGASSTSGAGPRGARRAEGPEASWSCRR